MQPKKGNMLSVVILTKNEEKNIVDCIDSVSFCDEVIVIDDNSDDRTVELAKRAKTKVFTRALDNDFSTQRNFGLEKAEGEWVLFVDADERIAFELAIEIQDLLRLSKSLESNAFFIKRRDVMWGRELMYGETGNIKLLRLARKNVGQWKGKVHETWKINGQIGELQNSILHYPHPTIAQFLEEINFYTDLRAKELYEKGIKVHWWSIIGYPKVKFLINYFLKRGFRDGVPGLMFALMMSFHSFLVRGKLWSLWEQKK